MVVPQRKLSHRALGNRISQLDSILHRKVEKSLCSIDPIDQRKESGDYINQSKTNTKIVSELLKKVKRRRKLVRSYSYFTWFCIFFVSYLGNLYIKTEQNEHMFSVDESIKHRIVDMLPTGNLNNNTQFYHWIDQVVADIYDSSVCGNGICERPEEFPALGRFGCASDCGLYPARSQIRIDTVPAWAARPAGLDLPGFKMGTGEGDDVRYTYNVYSETLGAYLLPADTSLPSVTLDVPDGDLWLELYQTTTGDMVGGRLDSNSPVAPTTMPPRQRRSDWGYGDAIEAISSAAAVSRQLQDYCDGDALASTAASSVGTATAAADSTCGGNFDVAVVSEALLGMYGLSGNITLLSRAGRETLLTFPFCSLQDGADEARIDPAMCGRRGACYNGTILARRFLCPSEHRFSVWAFGPPRNVTVRPPDPPPDRVLTPYNSLIGGVIVTQYVRAETQCTHPNTPAISKLTGRYPCQFPARATGPFGIDPLFQRASELYNGKLAAADYYAPNELHPISGDPYAFFPHQWGRGGPKDPALISPEAAGTYKLFFDVRLRPERARFLAQQVRDGHFITSQTDWVEVEIITYNPDFNLFGVLTVQFTWQQGGGTRWAYQYNTALLSPYEGARGQISLLLDATVCIFLLVDMVHEMREINHFRLKGNLVNGYLLNFWNCFEWAHFAMLSVAYMWWGVYNQYATSIGFRPGYPILADLEAEARSFATDATAEYDLLDFAGKMRELSELKNTWTALSCINVLFFVLRFLKVLDFQPRMSLITRTLSNSVLDLGHYLALIAIIITGYASIGTLLVGDRVKDLESFWGASCALATILMGWEPQVHYTAMLDATNQANLFATSAVYQFFFWSWVIVATFLMLNIVMAIIVDAFANVKRSLRDAPTLAAELSSLCFYAARIVANRLVGSDWLVSDREFEKVLASHVRTISSDRRSMVARQAVRIRGIGQSKAIRIPGGLRVAPRDMEELLRADGPWAFQKSFMRRMKPLRMSTRRFLGLKSGFGKLGTHEDGVLIADMGDGGYNSKVMVHDLMNRYGEVLCDGHADEELLELLQTEKLRQEMAMCASQNQVCDRIEEIVSIIEPLVAAVLPKDSVNAVHERRRKRRAERFRRSTGSTRSRADYSFRGTLQITIVSAKNLPKLDLFSESDPYCVLLIEDQVAKFGSLPIVLAGTDVRSNDANPIWNSQHNVRLRCTAGARLIAAVLDRDEFGSDELLGTVRISVPDLQMDEEVDRWYRLRNDSDPARTRNRRALLRIRATLIPEHQPLRQARPAMGELANEEEQAQQGTNMDEQATSEQSPALPAADISPAVATRAAPQTPSVRKVLEITLVSACHLPKRGRLLSKLSLCDPYAILISEAADGRRAEFASVVRRNTYCPVWNQGFIFEWEDSDETEDPDAVLIRIAVLDWNRFTEHDLLGTVEVRRGFLRALLGPKSGDPASVGVVGEAQRRTFALRRDGARVVGNDGLRAELALVFRISERRRIGSSHSLDRFLEAGGGSLPSRSRASRTVPSD